MDYEWRTERRNTPDDQLHVLHKKWFSQELEDWITRQRKITYETSLLSHGIHDQYIIDLINVKNECPLEWLPEGVEDDIGAVISATLNMDVQTSALLTMKGDMAHIQDLQSYLTFRNKGEIKASLTFDAWAELRFPDWEKTLFGEFFSLRHPRPPAMQAATDWNRYRSSRAELQGPWRCHRRPRVQGDCGARRPNGNSRVSLPSSVDNTNALFRSSPITGSFSVPAMLELTSRSSRGTTPRRFLTRETSQLTKTMRKKPRPARTRARLHSAGKLM